MNSISVSDMKQVLPVDGKRKQVVSDADQDTNEIIKYVKIQYNLDKNQKHYDMIALPLWKGSVRDTAEMIFKVLRKHVRYEIEHEKDQTTKTPGRILYDGHGDCKHYALFATGAANALERMGYPIHAKFRFVADRPDMEVHHVFSVITDKTNGKEYWVDPVLTRFDDRPSFHNIKDADMPGVGAISMLSGTGAGVAIPMVGKKAKKKHRNIFREVAHGMEVNAHNIKHGIDVNTKNIKHGMDVNFANAKNMVLKVGGAPARNSFLALVDFNMFNLAKRLHEALLGPKGGALMEEWKKMGGNPNKLKSAVNNGIKNYNKHHGSKIHGFDHRTWHHHNELHNPHGQFLYEYPHHLSNEPWHRGLAPERMRGMKVGCGCCEGHGAVGCLPACAAAMIALATAIIGVLSKFLRHSPADDKAMADASKHGTMELMKTASNAIDAANGDTDGADGGMVTAALKTITAPGAGGGMSVSTGVTPDGEPALQIHDVDTPATNQAGQPITDADADSDDSAGGGVSKTPVGGDDFIEKFTAKAKDMWANHKTAIVVVTLAVVASRSKAVKKHFR